MMCKCQVWQKDKKSGRYFLRPCGQCLACRVNDTRDWFVRSHFELKKLERPFHYFLTLTYDDEHLPDDGLCHKEDLKKFLNNLNTSFGLKMRYFATSDYGSINNRAHYHAIILSSCKVTPAQISRIWKKGFIYLKPCNTENIKYTLRYTVKKKPFEKGDNRNFRLISKGWGDNVAKYYAGQEYFVIDGKKYRIPEYCCQKIGLDKPETTTYYSVESSILNCPNYFEKTGSERKWVEEMEKLIQYRRRLK